MKTPALLVIMDGFGIAESGPGNAISLADKPHLDYLLSGKDYPVRLIEACGENVGLPAGQMGNSEVGHLNIGSGRIIYQDLSRINNAIADGSILSNEVLVKIMDAVKERGNTLHFMGLLSDGGVHSEIEHLEALIDMACGRGVSSVHVHAFMDGRDVSPTSGAGYVEELEEHLASVRGEFGADAIIASLGGRYYGMDRDNRWERVKRHWDTIVIPNEASKGYITELSPKAAVEASYSEGVTDEFIVPVAFCDAGVRDGDGIIFFNFRPDRARELTRAFTQPGFDGFDKVLSPEVDYVCMTEYDASFGLPIAFPKEFPEMVMADAISAMGLKQLHIAETEKYAHVTFFLNGGVEAPKEGEERILIPSPKVATYDLQPEMSAYEVCDALVDAIANDRAQFYIVNFANCDMVGHTGSISAAKAAVEAVDACVARLVKAIKDKKGVCLITADHGNADVMLTEDGSPMTAHSLSPVPLIAIDESGESDKLAFVDGDGRLADIAPTFFDLAGVKIPELWTGRSLLAR